MANSFVQPDTQVPATPAPAASRPVFYPALDGLRAIAFLLVFGQHYLYLSWGWTGVDIFFVLSGFLITGILFDTKDQPHRVWNFYIRRTLRIFPIYYGIFFLLLIADPIFKWEWSVKWILWPLYLGNFARFIHPYLVNTDLQRLADAQAFSHTFPGIAMIMGHFWSLCVEEQFYLVWPWVVFWVKNIRRLLWICLASVLLTPVLRLAGTHLLPAFMLRGEILYRLIFFRTDALLLGGLLALILRAGHQRSLLRAARFVAVACIAVMIAALILHPEARVLQRTVYPHWIFTWGLSFVDLFAATLIVMALDPGSWIYRLLNLRPLRWLGRISYGAYVFHDIPHHLFNQLCASWNHPGQGWVAAIALPATLAMAWLSYRRFESPFIRLKERLTR